MSTVETIQDELLSLVIGHDWSYMMSDDHRVWDAGLQVERSIKAKIHALVAIHREDAEALKGIVKGIAGPDYSDTDVYGYGLKYRTINGWFREYVGLAEF
jgi:hypothetical protein